jgi:hypothetical protein
MWRMTLRRWNNTLGVRDVLAEGTPVRRSAADDIKMVEGWGYTQSEALEMVTRRAVFEARRVAEEARTAHACDQTTADA